MMVYWNNLNDRERWMLGFGSVCLVVFLFYLFIKYCLYYCNFVIT